MKKGGKWNSFRSTVKGAVVFSNVKIMVFI